MMCLNDYKAHSFDLLSSIEEITKCCKIDIASYLADGAKQ